MKGSRTRLDALIAGLELTNNDVGDALGYAPSTISRYRCGGRRIHRETYERLADFFLDNASEREILRRIDPKRAADPPADRAALRKLLLRWLSSKEDAPDMQEHPVGGADGMLAALRSLAARMRERGFGDTVYVNILHARAALLYNPGVIEALGEIADACARVAFVLEQEPDPADFARLLRAYLPLIARGKAEFSCRKGGVVALTPIGVYARGIGYLMIHPAFLERESAVTAVSADPALLLLQEAQALAYAEATFPLLRSDEEQLRALDPDALLYGPGPLTCVWDGVPPLLCDLEELGRLFRARGYGADGEALLLRMRRERERLAALIEGGSQVVLSPSYPALEALIAAREGEFAGLRVGVDDAFLAGVRGTIAAWRQAGATLVLRMGEPASGACVYIKGGKGLLFAGQDGIVRAFAPYWPSLTAAREAFLDGNALRGDDAEAALDALLSGATAKAAARPVPQEPSDEGLFHNIRRDMLFNRSLPGLAREIHADYLRQVGPGEDRNTSFAFAWDTLDEETRESNLRQAAGIREKLAALGCDCDLADARRAWIGDFTADEIMLLARLEHYIWMQERIAKGWTFAPERDNAAKKHNLLVPWELLDDENVDKNVATARAILPMLEKIGLRVYRA